MQTASQGIVEALLRIVAVGSGLTLITIAVWHVAVDTSLATVTAVLGSDTTQWFVVVAFGCTLILAARRSRSSGGNRR